MSDLYKGTMPKLRTGKPLYRISTGCLGAEKPPKLGELSDAEIVEFYRFQARDGFGRQAIEELSRTEKRPVSEILRILHEHGTALKYKLEDIEAMKKFSQQTKEAVILDRSAGIPAKTIAEQQGLTEQQVYTIYNEYKKKVKREADAGEPAKTQEGKEKMSRPLNLTPGQRVQLLDDADRGMNKNDLADKYHLTPQQVYAFVRNSKKSQSAEKSAQVSESKPELPEPVQPAEEQKELPVKLYEPSECYTGICEQTLTVKAAGIWEAIADELRDIAIGLLGAGTALTDKSSSEKSEYASVKLITPDGKKVKIKMEVI